MLKLKGQMSRILSIIVAVINLSSCAGVIRITGFESEHKAGIGYGFSEYKISKTVDLSSSCEQRITAFIGPYIGIPLPIIPNPFYFNDYNKYKDRKALIFLSLCALKDQIKYQQVSIHVSLDGKTLEIVDIQSSTFVASNEYYDFIKYVFNTNVSCGELENAELNVRIEGLPESIKENRVRFIHKWQIYSDGP